LLQFFLSQEDAIEIVIAKGAGISSLLDELSSAPNEVTVTAKGAGFGSTHNPNPPVEFIETIQTIAAGLANAGDPDVDLVEAIRVIGEGAASLIEEYTRANPIEISETIRVKGAFVASVVTDMLEVNQDTRTIGKGTADLTEILDSVDALTAVAAGKAALQAGGTEAVIITAVAGGKCSVSVVQNAVDRPDINAGGLPSVTDLDPANEEIVFVLAGGYVQDADTNVGNEDELDVNAKGGGKSSVLSIQTGGGEIVNAKGEGNASESERLQATDRPETNAGGLPTLAGEERGATDDPRAIGEAFSSVIEAHEFVDTVTAKGAGIARVNADITNPGGLIPAIRRNSRLALSELLSIPEGLPEKAPEDKLPMLAIVAQRPEENSDFAVRDQAQWVDIDLVYAMKRVRSGVDNSQYIRGRLAILRAALLADPTQHDPSGLPTAVDTQTAMTPYERENEYMAYFMELNTGFEIMVQTIRCLVIESTV
jgi:hypothetical protein